jgi:hypothetical protein
MMTMSIMSIIWLATGTRLTFCVCGNEASVIVLNTGLSKDIYIYAYAELFKEDKLFSNCA